MNVILKELLFNSAFGQDNTIGVVSGKVRLNAGLFTFLDNAKPLLLSGLFFCLIVVPASASLVGTVTFAEIGPMDVAAQTVISVENNDPANCSRFMVEVVGCYSGAVIGGAGVTADIFFVGYGLGY